MSNIGQARRALMQRVLEGDGKASLSERRDAFDNVGHAEPMRVLVDKVARRAWTVTDADIAAARGGAHRSEDQIFEIVVCAAIGQAIREYDAAFAALESVIGKR